MRRPLYLLRFVLLPSAFVVVVMYFYLYPALATVNIEHQIDGDDSVKVVVYTPNQLFGNQMARTMDRVNELNMGTGEGGGCRKSCKWTMDRNKMSNADAVVFYFFTVGYERKDMPTEVRRPDQIWAMHTREAPPYSWCEMNKLNGVFNWTINYRKDSDIWGPYGRKIATLTNSNEASVPISFSDSKLHELIAGKEKLVIAVMSRCQTHSRREVLVENLKKAGLPIQIYGKCGKPLCGRPNENCTELWNEIGRKYKFYLAFENSICTDYITEKFWRSLELGMVPVVYGGGDYLDEAPPNSYIDVRSFGSAKELTQYLLKLDKEPEEYKQFFEWRNHFTTVRGGGEWCKFCAALHERKALITKPTKVYEDLDSWYWQRDPHSDQNKACQENPQFFKDNNN